MALGRSLGAALGTPNGVTDKELLGVVLGRSDGAPDGESLGDLLVGLCHDNESRL